MPITAEDRTRETIDKLLSDAGWVIQSRDEANISAGRGVAIREFPLKPGYDEADYLLYVDRVPAGVVEAKKEGATLGYEIQTNLKRADSLHQSILKCAFEGKLVPQDPNDESASALLETIRSAVTRGTAISGCAPPNQLKSSRTLARRKSLQKVV